MGLFFKKSKQNTDGALSEKEIKKIGRTLFSAHPLTDPQQRKLLFLAAPMRAKNQDAVDCLPAYSNQTKQRLSAMFSAQFQTLTKESLIHQIEAAYCAETAAHYDTLLSLAKENDEQSLLPFLSRTLHANERCAQKASLLCAYADRLQAANFDPNASACAYDLCRAANFAVIGLGLGLLSEAEMFSFLSKIADKANEQYDSYASYCSGYLLGRGCHIWLTGEFMALLSDADQSICRVLLTHPNSPYAQDDSAL